MADEAVDIEAQIGEKVQGLLHSEEITPPEEPEQTDEPQEDSPVEENELLLGKFKSVDELTAAYQELERKQGSTGGELGELRKFKEQVEQYLPALQQMQQQAAQPTPLTQEAVSAFDEMVDDNPSQAAQWALQTGQQLLYERAMDSWYMEDPKGASRFERSMEMSQVQEQIRTHSQGTEFQQAWDAIRRDHPDVDSYAQAMTEVAQQAPQLAYLLNGGLAEKQQLLGILYDVARSRTGTFQAAQTAPAPTPPPAHVVSGEAGRPEASQKPLDVMQHAIRQHLRSEPNIN